MIQFKPISKSDLTDINKLIMDEDGWIDLFLYEDITEGDFKIVTVKVNGVVYTERSAEFLAVYEQAKIWDKLGAN